MKNKESENLDKMITLKNENPTDLEKKIYHRYGFYPIEKKFYNINNQVTDFPYIRYAVCYTDESMRKEYPTTITIKSKCINYNETLFFDGLSACIDVHTDADIGLLEDIISMAKELGFSEMHTKNE